MFESLFRRPLELTINNQVLEFDSVDDFEFALSGRADVPGPHVALLMGMPDEALRGEVSRLRHEERRLREHFAESLNDLDRLEKRFGRLEAAAVRTDHDWREIVTALLASGAEYAALKRSAVVHYLRYLDSRARFVREILDARSVPGVASQEKPGFDTATQAIDPQLLGERLASPSIVRLPRGQRALVLPIDCKRVSLRFAAHPASIRRGLELTLSYDDAEHWRLPVGRTIVGRDESCDVTLSGRMKDISRKHAIIEVGRDGEVWITDSSTHGTYLVETTAGSGP